MFATCNFIARKVSSKIIENAESCKNKIYMTYGRKKHVKWKWVTHAH